MHILNATWRSSCFTVCTVSNMLRFLSLSRIIVQHRLTYMFIFSHSQHRATQNYCEMFTHFHFDIMGILWELFVFGTVSGLIKLPHKMIHEDDENRKKQCVFASTILNWKFGFSIVFLSRQCGWSTWISQFVQYSITTTILIKSFHRLRVLKIEKQIQQLLIEMYNKS